MLRPLPAAGADVNAVFDGTFDGKSIVLLGESLHITAELPRVRLPILRYLKTQGFDVLAVEGSALDAWLAEDDLLHAPADPEVLLKASREGWLAIWNTAEMREVLAWVRTNMYFASMDIQPAMGKHKEVLAAFLARLSAYAGEDATDLVASLEPLRTCSGPQPPPKQRAYAIQRVYELVTKATPKVRAVSPMHANALALVPEMLEKRMHHCAELDSKDYWRTYKESRDRYQAANVLALRDRVSATHRVVVWAHHSHVGYRGAGAGASVSIGGVLRERAPGQTYALGLYAGSGEYLRSEDGPQDRLTITAVPPPGDPGFSGVDALRALSADPNGYFLDVQRAPVGREPLGYMLEGKSVTLPLAGDFDGIVFVPHVTTAKLDE